MLDVKFMTGLIKSLAILNMRDFIEIKYPPSSKLYKFAIVRILKRIFVIKNDSFL